LGGLPTEDGADTRFGSVIRADNVRRLHDAQTLVEHGVTRVVDLRLARELADDPIDELPVEAMHVSLLGEWDDEYHALLEQEMLVRPPLDYLTWSYLDALGRFGGRFATAVRAIASAPAGTVCIHCMSGRDRTGLLSALLLRLAGVSVDNAATDYAESGARLAESHARWVAEAPDGDERARRAVFSHAPASVMRDVLNTLEQRHGAVGGYLHGAGVTDGEIDAVRSRLRDDR
jgi:protein-tyrosine phosphatase